MLYGRLAEVGCAGPDFDAVAGALVRYAYTVLCSWLASGHIVDECRRVGVRRLGRLGSGALVLTRHDVEDLAQETLRRALERFVIDGRAGQGWSPGGGAALSTYFVRSCVLRFGDVYRAWERDERQPRPKGDRSAFYGSPRQSYPTWSTWSSSEAAPTWTGATTSTATPKPGTSCASTARPHPKRPTC